MWTYTYHPSDTAVHPSIRHTDGCTRHFCALPCCTMLCCTLMYLRRPYCILLCRSLLCSALLCSALLCSIPLHCKPKLRQAIRDIQVSTIKVSRTSTYTGFMFSRNTRPPTCPPRCQTMVTKTSNQNVELDGRPSLQNMPSCLQRQVT